MDKGRLQCDVNNKTLKEIKEYAKSFELTQGQFIDQVIESFESEKETFTDQDELLNNFFGFKTVEDRDTVKQALKLSELSFRDFAAKALLRDARSIMTREAQMKKVEDLKPEELVNSTLKGVVEIRVLPILEKIIAYNDAQAEKENKFFINTSLLTKASGSNFGSIKKLVEKYSETIDTHNNKHGLTKGDNRKGKGSNLDIREIVKDA